MPFTPMSPILVAGLTIAMRFIFARCCARAASGHVAAVPPKSVMKSRRCMYPLRENLIDASSLTLCDGAAGGKGQPIDHRRCDPMSGLGQNRRFDPLRATSGL